MKKVFASDFDGTLYFHWADVKLPPQSVRKIREYQEAGGLFGLCTGRNVGGIVPFVEGHFSPDFYITSSGANILDKSLKPVARCGISRTDADAIVSDLGTGNYRIIIDIGGDICAFSELDYLKMENYRIIRSLGSAPEGMVHQLSVHAESPGQAQDIASYINRAYGNAVEAFRNVSEVDIAPKGCSKGRGASLLRGFLQKTHGPCRLYGIGDSMNDLPLLEAADVSYTFPCAPGELQETASKVVEDIREALEDSMRE